MSMRKVLASFLLTGIVSLSSLTSAFAAGLGIVDFYYIEQHHPNYNDAVKQYQTDVRKSQTEYAAKSKELANKEKQTMANEYNTKLNQQRIALFKPIDQDVLNVINKVRTRKGLDYVAAKGYVLSGAGIVDITSDVEQEIVKLKK